MPVQPTLTHNLYLDHVLRLKRGPDGVELEPEMCMTCGDGYLHFSIVATVAEEAAWQAVGNDHAVPAHISIQLLRPAHVNEGMLLGIGVPLRCGKAIIASEGCVTQGMKLIAKATVTFVHFLKDPNAVPARAA